MATSLGAVIHELGHSLDLVHSDEGIMARGFDDINVYFLPNVSPGIAVIQDDVSDRKTKGSSAPCSKPARRPKLSFCSNHEKLPDEDEDEDGEDSSKPKFTSIGIRTRGQELLDGYHERKFYARLKKEFGGAFWCRSHALILDSHR